MYNDFRRTHFVNATTMQKRECPVIISCLLLWSHYRVLPREKRFAEGKFAESHPWETHLGSQLPKERGHTGEVDLGVAPVVSRCAHTRISSRVFKVLLEPCSTGTWYGLGN